MKTSIAMTTYNGERYLLEQLESFACQTQLPDELIVCDDGSTDATVDIIRQFSVSATFSVKLYINEQNLGSTKNFEKAIRQCSGEIIFLSDQDDVWRADKLAWMSRLFEECPDTGAIFSDANVVDSSLQSLGYRLWGSVGFNRVKQKRMSTGESVNVLLKANVVTGATMAFRAKFIPDILPIPKIWIHDGWIALLVAASSEIQLITEPLLLYRQHLNNQIGGVRKTLLDRMKIVKRTNTKVYLDLAEQYMAVKERLEVSIKEKTHSDMGVMLEDKIRHLQIRAHMPPSLIKRFPLVMRELTAFRYHRYSDGLKSFLKDIALPR